MKIDNVFYFKNIVDTYYPDEDRPAVDIQSVVDDVKEKIETLSDDDFIEVMISCFIPDLYSGMGKREKLFTKLTELMVGEWWRRMGGYYRLPTKKSGTEDVELTYKDFSIVCDAKVFRLGRSQKAPNVKDFLKLASVKLWIDNLNETYKRSKVARSVIGGLVTYSSLHEWKSDSEVYEECTNHDTPVVMLPYELLALLLKYKTKFNMLSFLKLWDYKGNNVITSRTKSDYWKYISNYLRNLIGITVEDYSLEIKNYHDRIILATKEYRGLVQSTVEEVRQSISEEVNKIDYIDALRKFTIEQLAVRDNAVALDYLKHIDDFRSYKNKDKKIKEEKY